MARTEKDKMLAGELYRPGSPELQADQAATKAWLVRYNAALGSSAEARGALLAERFAEAGILALPVTWEHAVRSGEIAAAHPDPFDRLLLAQAMHEPMHLLTSDAALARYSDNVIDV